MHARREKFAALGACALLAACAGGSGAYPSLAVRPFESGAGSAALPPSAPQPANQRPLADAATLDRLRSDAAQAHAAFLALEPATDRLVRGAAGQSVETRARAAALVSLADLATKRAATSAVLADIDLMASEAATALTPDPGLAAVQSEVTALVAREDAGLARLREILGS